jgi:hypothetical protein
MRRIAGTCFAECTVPSHRYQGILEAGWWTVTDLLGGGIHRDAVHEDGDPLCTVALLRPRRREA